MVTCQQAGPQIIRLTRNGVLLFPASTLPDEFPAVWQRQDTIRMESARTGQYEAITADGKHLRATLQNSALQREVKGTWDVRFTPGWGAPELCRFPSLTC